jgi:simple sugar transport system permease protein
LILVGIYLKKSKLGLTARFIRTNPENETLSRINIPAYQCLGLTISGGISGLAGSMLIFGGPTFTLSDGVGAREGLDGIVVALLAQGSITGIFLSAALIAITQRGAAWASVTIGLSKDSGYMIQGILVISMAATFNSNFVNKTNKLLIQLKKRCGSSNEPV